VVKLVVMAARKTARKSNKVKKARKKTQTSWKRSKSAKKIIKKIKIAIFAVITVLLTTLSLYAINTIKLLKTQVAGANENLNKIIMWNGKSPINVLMLTEQESGIIRINPEIKRYTFVKFESEDLKEAIGDLGIPVNNYIKLNLEAEGIFKKLIGDYHKGQVYGGNYLSLLINIKSSFSELTQGIETNLTLKELTELVLAMNSLQKGEVFEVNKDLFNDHFKFDSLWQNIVIDKGVSNEGLSVMVLNGSGVVGVAGRTTRILKNSGLYTLDPANAKDTYDNSFIVRLKNGTLNTNSENTVNAIKSALGIGAVLERDTYNEYGNFADRADIIVIIGIDRVDDF